MRRIHSLATLRVRQHCFASDVFFFKKQQQHRVMQTSNQLNIAVAQHHIDHTALDPKTRIMQRYVCHDARSTAFLTDILLYKQPMITLSYTNAVHQTRRCRSIIIQHGVSRYQRVQFQHSHKSHNTLSLYPAIHGTVMNINFKRKAQSIKLSN